MGRMDHWETALEELAPVCRPIALGLPIFDVRLAEPSIGELVRHVVRFLDALEIPSAVVGGNSLGGRVAIEMAIAHPERGAGLVLPRSAWPFQRVSTAGGP